MPGRKPLGAHRHQRRPVTELPSTDHYAGTVLGLMLLGGSMIGFAASDMLPKKLVWNASKSVPIGLYVIEGRVPVRGDLVLIQFPKWVALIARQRNYLLPYLPALKVVSALSDDVVCRFDEAITINGKSVAKAHFRDELGRKMPVWMGCRTLKAGEVFLLTDHPNSFDGRYFGVTQTTNLLGVAKPIWIPAK